MIMKGIIFGLLAVTLTYIFELFLKSKGIDINKFEILITNLLILNSIFLIYIFNHIIESEIIALKAKLKRLDKKKTKLLEQIKTAREEKYGQGQICDKCEDI